MTARFRVTHAGPYVSFQDGGRPGNLRFGIPRSGPMDRLSHAAANTAIGNDAEATAIEVSRAGLSLECVEGSVTVAVTGGDFTASTSTRAASWNAQALRPGDQIKVQPGSWGSWAYLAVMGELDVTSWLGHTATHSRSGFGGGALVTGQEITVNGVATDSIREGEIPAPTFAAPEKGLTHAVRVVLGPQDHHFADETITTFCDTEYTLSDAYDRMGVRLDGARLGLLGALSIPSEPIVRGSIQVGGDEVPTVLLADHQTTGGYPKIATIISADIDRFSQLRSGQTVRFTAISASDAIVAAREYASAVATYLDQIAQPGRTLTHRLMREDLIGSVHEDL